ncbi:MAG TPA: LysR family transcriptional regulator [Amycolatopsis sp.]|nr:LysR family transcriptional regulator [Amycolatopsis sp.]
MELRTLEYFIAVAEEESFTRAAARCRVAQPAISQQIRGLERELGETLFDRDSRSVRLSAAGQVLLPHARAALAAVASANAEFAARAGLLKGELDLGSVDGVEITALPEMLGTFHRHHPGVAVRLVGGTSADLLARVQHGSLDAAVIARPAEPLHDSLSHRTLLRDQIVAIVPRERPEAAKDTIDLAAFADTSLISYGEDSGLWAHLAHAFRKAGLPFRPAYATNDVALLVALAAAGVGIALAAGADPEVTQDPRVLAIPLAPRIGYEKALVWRRRPAPSAPLRALLALSVAPSQDDNRSR